MSVTASTKTNRSWKQQAPRFLLSGGAAALTDIGTYALLTGPLAVPPLTANLVSRPLGGLVSFILNKLWTFGHRSSEGTGGQFLRYAAVWTATYLTSEGLVGLFFNLLGMAALPSKLIAEAMLGVATFLVHRFWTFRQN